jgi:hypothetical protein
MIWCNRNPVASDGRDMLLRTATREMRVLELAQNHAAGNTRGHACSDIAYYAGTAPTLGEQDFS